MKTHTNTIQEHPPFVFWYKMYLFLFFFFFIKNIIQKKNLASHVFAII